MRISLVVLALLLAGCAAEPATAPDAENGPPAAIEAEPDAAEAEDPPPPAQPESEPEVDPLVERCLDVWELAEELDEEIDVVSAIFDAAIDASEEEQQAIADGIGPRFYRALEAASILVEQNPECFTAEYRLRIEQAIRNMEQ